MSAGARAAWARRLALGLLLGSALAAQAGVLERLQRTGVVTMGVRDASGGLSLALGEGRYGGFHVALCERVLEDLRAQLKLPRLEIRYQPVTSQNRIAFMQNGTLDIECGSTTHTLQRQKDVAFALTTYVEEVRIAVRAGSGIRSIAQLDGRRVATTTGTTSVQHLRRHERAAGVHFEEVFGRDHAESFDLLASDRADAFVMDGQILAASIARSADPASFRLLPEVLSVEPIAIMLPKDDPAFAKAVDRCLLAVMASGEIARIYVQWFMAPIPPSSRAIGLPASAATREAWANPNHKPLESYAAH